MAVVGRKYVFRQLDCLDWVEHVLTANTSHSSAAVFIDDSDYLRRTDIAVATYPVISDEGKRRRYALLEII